MLAKLPQQTLTAHVLRTYSAHCNLQGNVTSRTQNLKPASELGSRKNFLRVLGYSHDMPRALIMMSLRLILDALMYMLLPPTHDAQLKAWLHFALPDCRQLPPHATLLYKFCIVGAGATRG